MFGEERNYEVAVVPERVAFYAKVLILRDCLIMRERLLMRTYLLCSQLKVRTKGVKCLQCHIKITRTNHNRFPERPGNMDRHVISPKNGSAFP